MTRILAYDLELSPIVAETWSLWPKAIPISMIKETQRVICFGAMWLDTGEYVFASEFHDGREAMVSRLNELLSEADATVTWNGRNFDRRHANREFLRLGLDVPPVRVEVDLMQAVKRQFFFASNKLDHVAQELGVGSKVHVDMSVWQGCLRGDAKAWLKMARYQKQDVVLLKKLYKILLPWIPASMHPNVALGALNGCTKCGSVKLEKRGYRATTTGTYQQYKCLACGSWSRGSQRLETTGLRPS